MSARGSHGVIQELRSRKRRCMAVGGIRRSACRARSRLSRPQYPPWYRRAGTVGSRRARSDKRSRGHARHARYAASPGLQQARPQEPSFALPRRRRRHHLLLLPRLWRAGTSLDAPRWRRFRQSVARRERATRRNRRRPASSSTAKASTAHRAMSGAPEPREQEKYDADDAFAARRKMVPGDEPAAGRARRHSARGARGPRERLSERAGPDVSLGVDEESRGGY